MMLTMRDAMRDVAALTHGAMKMMLKVSSKMTPPLFTIAGRRPRSSIELECVSQRHYYHASADTISRRALRIPSIG